MRNAILIATWDPSVAACDPLPLREPGPASAIFSGSPILYHTPQTPVDAYH